MRIGIVASSGGATFQAMRLLFPARCSLNFFVVTDRPCGIEAYCNAEKIALKRFSTDDNQAFSSQTADWFAENQVQFVLLYYLRLVTAELFERFPTYNIHPSLLPAFPGFHPVERAAAKQVRFLGATAHRVDDHPDQGPVVAQVTMPISPTDPVEQLHKFSYVQKVYLSALLVEMHLSNNAGTAYTDRCNPRVADPELWNALLALQTREGVEVLR